MEKGYLTTEVLGGLIFFCCLIDLDQWVTCLIDEVKDAVQSRKALLYFTRNFYQLFINSDSNLTQAQILTQTNLNPNLYPKKANEKCVDEYYSFSF